jgi:hypothetical protein
MRKFVFVILIALLSIISCPFEGKCEVFRQINMNKGDIYLLKFAESYNKFEIGNTKAIKVEKNTKIFNDEYQLVLSALQAEDTNLLVWTKNNLYIYKICINKTQIFNNNNEKSDFLMKIDRPPLRPLKVNDNTKN